MGSDRRGVQSFGRPREEPDKQHHQPGVILPPVMMPPVEVPLVLRVDAEALMLASDAIRNMVAGAVMAGFADAMSRMPTEDEPAPDQPGT